MALCQNLAIPDHLVRAFIHGRRSTQKSGEGDHGQNIKRMSVWRIRTVVKKTYKQIRFTERCTLGQSAVLRSHVVCPSVCLSVTLVNCDHIGWNSSETISPLVSLGRSLFATPT